MTNELTQEQKFLDEMSSKRSVTLRLAGVREDELNEEQRQALDAYMRAVESYYEQRWGKFGLPRGSVLREESEAETETREAWEEAIKPLQEHGSFEDWLNDLAEGLDA